MKELSLTHPELFSYSKDIQSYGWGKQPQVRLGWQIKQVCVPEEEELLRWKCHRVLLPVLCLSASPCPSAFVRTAVRIAGDQGTCKTLVCPVPHGISFSVFTEPSLNFAMCYNLFRRLLCVHQGFRRKGMHVINQKLIFHQFGELRCSCSSLSYGSFWNFCRVLWVLLARFVPFTVIQHSDLCLCSQKVLDETSFARLLYFFTAAAEQPPGSCCSASHSELCWPRES